MEGATLLSNDPARREIAQLARHGFSMTADSAGQFGMGGGGRDPPTLLLSNGGRGLRHPNEFTVQPSPDAQRAELEDPVGQPPHVAAEPASQPQGGGAGGAGAGDEVGHRHEYHLEIGHGDDVRGLTLSIEGGEFTEQVAGK